MGLGKLVKRRPGSQLFMFDEIYENYYFKIEHEVTADIIHKSPGLVMKSNRIQQKAN